MKADPDVIAVAFPEPQHKLLFEAFKMGYEAGKHPPNLYADVIAVIDSILAEAGDERAPVRLYTRHGVDCRKVLHKTGTAYEHGEYDDNSYDVDGVSYCGRCHVWMGALADSDNALSQHTIQGWVDRLRGIRAALETIKPEQSREGEQDVEQGHI